MISLDALRIDVASAFATPREGTGRVVRLRKNRFLRGPIDWAWISRAGTGAGRALHVGITLWLERGMRGSDTVTLSYTRLKDMEVDRHAGRRGLAELERLGLVAVGRTQGRSPVVTILPIQGSGDGGSTGAP